MPRFNIWIRQEDLSAWTALQDRPEFLHRALGGTERLSGGLVEVGSLKEMAFPDLCPHHMIRGACGHASCKKPR